MAAIDLGALKDKPAEPEGPIEVEAAFIVVIRGPGIVQASPDINAPIAPTREISIEEMQMACRKVAEDIQMSKTANLIQVSMQQAASQAFQNAENRNLANSLRL